MLSKRLRHSAAAVLALTSLGCELSLTGPDLAPDVVPSLADVVPSLAIERVTAPNAASVVGSTCVAPGSQVSWWPGEDSFDDVAGTNPISRSGGVAFEPGTVGQAFRFDQRLGQPYLEIDDSPDLRPSTFTIDFWAQRLSGGQNNNDQVGNVLVEKAIDDANLAGLILSYFIAWNRDDRIVAGLFFEDDVGAPVRLLGTSVHPFGSVVHVALSFDGTTATLYVNGAAEDTFDASGRPPVAYGPGSMVVGATFRAARNAGFPRSPDGLIDELEILDYALGPEQVREIYATDGACKLEPEQEEPPSALDVDVDIKPGSDRNPIRVSLSHDQQMSRAHGKGTQSRGTHTSVGEDRTGPALPVALLGSNGFDVTGVDVGTVTLGDEVDLDVGVTTKGGRGEGLQEDEQPPYHASLSDVNNDGTVDLIMHFDLDALVRNGDVDVETTELCLNGATFDGALIRGCDAVTVLAR